MESMYYDFTRKTGISEFTCYFVATDHLDPSQLSRVKWQERSSCILLSVRKRLAPWVNNNNCIKKSELLACSMYRDPTLLHMPSRKPQLSKKCHSPLPAKHPFFWDGLYWHFRIKNTAETTKKSRQWYIRDKGFPYYCFLNFLVSSEWGNDNIKTVGGVATQ